MLRHRDQCEHDRGRDADHGEAGGRREQPGEAEPAARRGRLLLYDGRALRPRGRDDAIAQICGRLAVGHREGQRGRRLESVFVGAAAIVAGSDVPLGERSLVGVERAQGMRADQRGDLLGNLVFTHA